MKIIAIEKHYTTPMYREKVSANEFRNFYLTSRSEQLGHDIVGELADLGEKRLAHMDAAGVDVQVLSFGSPDHRRSTRKRRSRWRATRTNRLAEVISVRPDRFAGLPRCPQRSRAAAGELERAVKHLGFNAERLLKL